MPDTVVARTPITAADPVERDGWQISARRSTADLTLTDESARAKVLVRGPFGGALRDIVGARFGRAVRTEQAGHPVLAVGSGPGEWLIIGPPATARPLRDHLEHAAQATGEFVSVLDLTHGRALIRLRGRRSAEVLAKICGIDLHHDSTPAGAALRTSVAGLATDLIRDDDPDTTTPSYLLHCERSSGQYLFDVLLDAGAEYGIDVTGPEHHT
ncbi:sarcosine oxidase subunit gamma [Pseudonocardia parietis]|uniref:Sarcosine oxidase subunit gamma n=1 Tax=Pseudonocardia parietis TaxID=570936 RepID=A0ABS4W443_9PSEU|nr:sarcosine oxidase subunit gamma family protein [Pseudonocardia parietis]MBP2370449.1 sarcosine oxidase subunit gamma [Pseudonocardia parietis]